MEQSTLQRLARESQDNRAWTQSDQNRVLCHIIELRRERDELNRTVDELAEANWRQPVAA